MSILITLLDLIYEYSKVVEDAAACMRQHVIYSIIYIIIKKFISSAWGCVRMLCLYMCGIHQHVDDVSRGDAVCIFVPGWRAWRGEAVV